MRMGKKQTIDTSKYKYTLLVGEGVYFASSVWGLFVEAITHRFWHWKAGDGWVD